MVGERIVDTVVRIPNFKLRYLVGRMSSSDTGNSGCQHNEEHLGGDYDAILFATVSASRRT